MHVFVEKSPVSARFKRGELRTAWANKQRKGEGGREREGISEKLDDPHPSSKLSALSLTVSSLHPSKLRVCLTSPFSPPFAGFLMPTTRFAHSSLSLSAPNGPSHEWPKKEMCLCLDFRQIICGNKFLCVQCHVIGFISRTTGSLPRVYLTLYLSVRGERTIDNRKEARYGACWIAVVVCRAREEWIGGHLPEKSTPNSFTA